MGDAVIAGRPGLSRVRSESPTHGGLGGVAWRRTGTVSSSRYPTFTVTPPLRHHDQAAASAVDSQTPPVLATSRRRAGRVRGSAAATATTASTATAMQAKAAPRHLPRVFPPLFRSAFPAVQTPVSSSAASDGGSSTGRSGSASGGSGKPTIPPSPAKLAGGPAAKPPVHIHRQMSSNMVTYLVTQGKVNQPRHPACVCSSPHALLHSSFGTTHGTTAPFLQVCTNATASSPPIGACHWFVHRSIPPPLLLHTTIACS